MPIALVRSYNAMLPRLQAEEHLAQMEAMTIGSGQAKPDEARARVTELEREALGGHRPRAKARPTADGLAALGIGVRMVDADGQEIEHG